jgi:hypothetical protein
VNNSDTFCIQSPNTTLNEVGFALTYSDSFQNSISFHGAGEEMLRLGPSGFYVRGVKLDLDDNEAKIVYNSFKEWLTWQQLNRG